MANPQGAPPGEAHPRSILTNEKVWAMRKRYAEGKANPEERMSILKLSNEFDCAVATAYAVISRRTWKHI